MHTPRKKETLTILIKKEIRKIRGNPYYKKEKEHDHLEIATKLLTLISSFAIIFGGIMVFIYLKSIQHLNLFTEAIGSPYGFMAILIAFGTLLLSIIISFITPYAIIIEKSNLPLETWVNFLSNNRFNRLFIASLCSHITYFLLIGFLIFHDVFKKTAKAEYINYFFIAIFLWPILISIIYFLNEKSTSFRKKIKIYYPIFIYTILNASLGLLLPIYISFLLVGWASGELNQYLLLVGHALVLLFNSILASFYLSSEKKSKNKKDLFFLSFVPTYIFIFLLFIFSENFPFRLLYLIRFIESPNDSSWYLLSQNNIEINSKDLKKIKSTFSCSQLEPQDENTKRICTKEANQRSNALFGYMAWNLGSMKVFCPVAAENNIKASKIKNMPNKCLTIESKALQKMHEGYISSHSMTP